MTPRLDLAAARAREAQRQRTIRYLRQVYRLGERVSVELALEAARQRADLDQLEAIAAEFASVDSKALHDLGADRFPPPPIYLMEGTPR